MEKVNGRRKEIKEQLTQIEAARKAVEAYKRAVLAVQEALGRGPVHGLGTTVMVMLSEASKFGKCSECESSGEAGWKFCAFCGAEIVRFERPKAPDHVTVGYSQKTIKVPLFSYAAEPAERKPLTVFVEVEKPKTSRMRDVPTR